jgi:hypothetical protein
MKGKRKSKLPTPTKKTISEALSSKQIQTGFDNLSKIDNFMKGVSKKNKTSKPSNMFGINKPKPPSGSIIESMKKSKDKPKKMSLEESMRHAMKHQKKKKPKDKNDSEDDKNED